MNDKEITTDLLIRQSRVLYPDVEDWIIKLAVEAYENEEKRATEENNE